MTRCAAFLAQIFDCYLLDINGFLSIIEPCPLFSMADDFAGRHFSPSGLFISPIFLCRSCARKGLYSSPKPPPITSPVIHFLFDFDWHPASMLPAISFPKIAHEQDQILLLFACVRVLFIR